MPNVQGSPLVFFFFTIQNLKLKHPAYTAWMKVCVGGGPFTVIVLSSVNPWG